MTKYIITAVEVHDGALYAPGGDVNDWCWEVSRDLERRANLYCPVRTGRLKASIKSGVWTMTNDTLMIDLSVDTPYAPFVLGGTAAQGAQYIYSNAGWRNKALIDRVMRRVNWRRQTWNDQSLLPRGSWMRLSDPGRKNYHLRVHGQKANPFIADAYAVTRREHTALPRLIGVPENPARVR